MNSLTPTTRKGVKSTKLMLVHVPNNTVLMNMVKGQYFLFLFHKSLVGYPTWKQMRQMLADIFQIEMFEASVTARMKKNHDKDDVRIAHTIGLISMFPVFAEIKNM